MAVDRKPERRYRRHPLWPGRQGRRHSQPPSRIRLLGGALKKGGIVGNSPTLTPAPLYENRDTAPTLDMRGIFKGVPRDHMGVDRVKLDTLVFPGGAGAAPVAGIVA